MAIISSNSPGSFTFKSLNNNVVSVTGNTVSINGIGTGEIEVTQAATSNFNEAKGILKVFVEKAKVVILDTDGDGIPDADDFVIDDNRIFSPSQFRFDADAWGTVMYKKKSNGKLDEFYGNVGSGFITPELDASPIGWDANITWRARTDASWITLTLTTASVVELERNSDGIKKVVVKGTQVPFNIAENNTGSDRQARIYIDYYYKGKYIDTASPESIKIKQSTIKPVTSTSDGTPIPDSATPDQTFDICSQEIYPFTGGQTFPQKIEINVGSATGSAELYANPSNQPDRFVLVHDGEIKIDTGYITQLSPSAYQQKLNNRLASRGLPTSTLQRVNYSLSGVEVLFRQWTKTSADSKAYLYIYAPLENTYWEAAVSCANQNLNNIRAKIRPGMGD